MDPGTQLIALTCQSYPHEKESWRTEELLSLPDTKMGTFGAPGHLWTVPEQDIPRQAVAPLRGYVYQLHQSAAAWIKLGPDDLLYLEVAEDFAQLLREPGRLDQILTATQVKDTRESGAVTLNSPDVIDAIRVLFRLKMSNIGRDVRLTFLTTSKIGRERKMPLQSGTAGLVAWQAAAQGGDVAEVRAALLARLEPSDLRTFIQTSSSKNLRNGLIRSLTFACGAEDWRTIQEANRRALVELRDEVKSTTDMAYRAYDAVIDYLISVALVVGCRKLDRRQLIGCLERATAIALPSQVVTGLFLAGADAKPAAQFELADLVAVAKALLEAGAPPSIALLFPDSSPTARSALANVATDERFVARLVTDPRLERSQEATSTIPALVTRPELQHLIVGQPGCGKTHTLWQTAGQLLAAGKVVPLYLPVAQLSTLSDLESLITSVFPNISLSSLFSDPRVCICIDGWSEFATGERSAERRKTLRALRGARVIANGRLADAGDTAFITWSLELLLPNQVARVLREAYPERPRPAQSVLELLRLPLVLSIHVLAGAKASAVGEIIRQFHNHAAHELPEAFTEALVEAVADSSLAGDRSFGRLASNLHLRARQKGVTEPSKLLQRLGTIVERAGQALPIHDLYWSWLAGLGLITASAAKLAVSALHTRESYCLALQSGACASDSDVLAVLKQDFVLATTLDRSRKARHPLPAVDIVLDHALSDQKLSVRNRAALAVIGVAEPAYLRRALNVLSELTRLGLYEADWSAALHPDLLFPHRATIADWLGSDGSEFVLDAIAERGGPEWTTWLEQLAIAGKISCVDALAAYLACGTGLPGWGEAVLDELVASKPWKLGAAATRRSNVDLAHRIARDYERLVDLVPDGSVWFHLNRVLVACGDDNVFRSLLACFGKMGIRAQELLGYAVVERGAPWVARFQCVAFVKSGSQHHHKLAGELSLDIDDATARKWIAAGYNEMGWRVLIARHGNAVLPDLVADLPASFGGAHDVPALAAMRFLENAPASLIDELWRRLGSPMQPKAMHDVLHALATVYPEGVPSIVQFITGRTDGLPVYHIQQVILLYMDWRKKFGSDLRVQLDEKDIGPFHQWIATHCALRNWDNHFTPMMLAMIPDLAINFVLEHLQSDDKKARAVLVQLRNLTTYNDALLDRMLAVPTLAALVPHVFSECLDALPAETLRRCLACPHIDQDTLMFRLSATSNPLHGSIHAELISMVLTRPMNRHHFRYIASMLKGHSRYDVLNLLGTAPCRDEDSWMWLVREVEAARGERLVDEDGNLRR